MFGLGCGALIGTLLGELLGMLLPVGVVKDFFLTSRSIGWGSQPGNWIDLYVIRFKTGFFIDISVMSFLGMIIAWYLLRYFK